jgi:mannose-6-phosphate isomerase-like protein (cupin superfamily)
MSDKIKQVALRIKALREIAGVGAEALARELNIPVETYLNYESGKTDIPVSFLLEFSHKFNAELTSLLTGEEPRLHQYCLVRKGKAPTVDRRKEYNYFDLAYNFIHKKAEVFFIKVDPHPESVKRKYYSHPGQEFTYVLEGTLKIVLDGHEVVLEKGDSLYFDSGKAHAMIAMRKKPAKFLAVIL